MPHPISNCVCKHYLAAQRPLWSRTRNAFGQRVHRLPQNQSRDDSGLQCPEIPKSSTSFFNALSPRCVLFFRACQTVRFARCPRSPPPTGSGMGSQIVPNLAAEPHAQDLFSPLGIDLVFGQAVRLCATACEPRSIGSAVPGQKPITRQEALTIVDSGRRGKGCFRPLSPRGFYSRSRPFEQIIDLNDRRGPEVRVRATGRADSPKVIYEVQLNASQRR